MSVEDAVKGLAILTAIPVVMFALWADYFGHLLEQAAKENPHYDRATELYKIRLAGLCAIFFQFGIFMGTNAVRKEAPVLANLFFVAGVLMQSGIQGALERKVRKPSPRLRPARNDAPEDSTSDGSSAPREYSTSTGQPEPLQEMDIALRAFFWATLGGALYLGGFALPVVVVTIVGKMFHASAPVLTGLVIASAIVGMISGVAINFALGAFYLRRMLPAREIGPGDLRTQLEACFADAAIPCPSLWVIESGRRREATAMMAGFPGGKGVFKPGLFISRGLLDALTPLEVRAVVLHEVSHLALKHLRRRLLFSAALVIGTTAAATFCVFLCGLFNPGGEVQSLVGLGAAGAAFVITFRQLGSQSRDHELEADRHSVEKLGADFEELSSALRKLDLINGRSASTTPLTLVGGRGHPETEHRIDALKARFGAAKADEAAKTAADDDQKRAA